MAIPVRLLNHDLSPETLLLIESIIRNHEIKLSIYTPSVWTLENVRAPGTFSFASDDDSDYLRDQLRRIGERGRI